LIASRKSFLSYAKTTQNSVVSLERNAQCRFFDKDRGVTAKAGHLHEALVCFPTWRCHVRLLHAAAR
jgi:hypothetical protein